MELRSPWVQVSEKLQASNRTTHDDLVDTLYTAISLHATTG